MYWMCLALDRSSFRKVLFSSYFEFLTMDKVQTPSDSEYTYMFSCSSQSATTGTSGFFRSGVK
jgi:hypothetical protein